MAFPGILKRLFENGGAGPLLRSNLFRQTNYITMLTASGTWTAPYDGYYLLEVQGGGGGGGSCVRTTSTANGGCICGGGQAGECLQRVKWYAKGTIVTYTIGAGGSHGNTASDGIGRDGGNTVFDGITGRGGAGGAGLVDPSSSNIYFSYSRLTEHNGTPGDPGNIDRYNTVSGGPTLARSGKGGGTIFGAGGSNAAVVIGTSASSTAGKDGTGHGSGGSGGAGYMATAYGGSGIAGCVRATYLGV